MCIRDRCWTPRHTAAIPQLSGRKIVEVESRICFKRVVIQNSLRCDRKCRPTEIGNSRHSMFVFAINRNAPYREALADARVEETLAVGRFHGDESASASELYWFPTLGAHFVELRIAGRSSHKVDPPAVVRPVRDGAAIRSGRQHSRRAAVSTNDINLRPA